MEVALIALFVYSRAPMTSLTYVAVVWLLHLASAPVAVFAGVRPWTGWVVLAIFVLLQFALLRTMDREAPRIATAVWVIGQSPGLLLSGWVFVSFIGWLPDNISAVAWLQYWTAVWTPLILWVPRGGWHAYYLWFTITLPALQTEAGLIFLYRQRRLARE